MTVALSTPLVTPRDDAVPDAATTKDPTTPAGLYLIGYDGSTASQRALTLGANLARTANARLEVVFVEHVPVAATWFSDALISVRESLQQTAVLLENEVSERLSGSGLTWHFHKRAGSIADQLASTAIELRTVMDDHPAVAVVVGASDSRVHRVLGAVSTQVKRHTEFEVLVA